MERLQTLAAAQEVILRAIAAVFVFAATIPAAHAQAQSSVEPADAAFTGHVLEPRKIKPDDLKLLEVPQDFEVGIFAEDLINPRMMAVSPDGNVYVTRRSVGDVVILRDTDGDGKADDRKIVANRPQMHGITIDGDTMYLATVKDVYKTTIAADGMLSELERIIDDLPDGGQHPNRTLGVGPDGMLYISVGSTCNACAETSPESATILRAAPDGSRRSVFASGLRNTIGFDWHPQSGALFGMDHNIDWHGDNQPEEELNRIGEGKNYGWPYVLADGFLNPADEPPGGITLKQWAKASQEPELLYTAHSAPMQMVFYKSKAFPSDYVGNAFVAMRGSWNRKPPSGYEVVRIVFQGDRPTRIEPFLTGFLQEEGGSYTRTARPAGIAVTNDGALLVSDDENGVIYRVAYRGEGPSATAPLQITAPDGDKSAKQSGRTQVAIKFLSAEDKPSLSLRSDAFENRRAIPLKYSNYGQNISPPLSWSSGPPETKSYAVVVDDPDARPKLVNHWGIYNIPADVTQLAEGVPTTPRLELPDGAFQTATTRGTVGYFGPKPPAGDGEHDYRFFVLALDTKLDLPVGASHDDLLVAMKGHVLAVGELIGSFGRDKDTQQIVDSAKD